MGIPKNYSFLVTPALGVTEEHFSHAVASRVFEEWVASLDDRFQTSSVFIQAVDFRGKPAPETVMFVRLRARASNAPFDQIVELRGGTVVLLPVLSCEGVDYTILVIQPRIASGNYELAEVPAGMLDNGQFRGVAAKELEEELELVFSEDELEELTKGEGVYFSPGLLDEQARFFLARREVTRQELAGLEGKATGLILESEKITLRVIKLADLPYATRDGKSLIAYCLYGVRAGR